LGDYNIALPHVDGTFLEGWALEAKRLVAGLRGEIDDRELDWYQARILFRDEKFDEAIELCKTLGGDRAKLMMASAARFTPSSLAYHLKRVQQVGKETLSLAFEASLLEAVIQAQLGKPLEAKAILQNLSGDHDRGFEARFVNIAVLNQAKLPTPLTDALEPKMAKVLGVRDMKVGDLPWPDWIARVDLEYLAGVRGDRDKKILERLAGLAWYPYRDRAAAHAKKARNEDGIQPGDLTAFQYQGYLVDQRR